MLIGHRCIRCHHVDFWNLNSARQGSIIHSGRLEGMTITDFRLIRRRCNTPECVDCQSFCEWGPSELFVRFHAGAFNVRVADIAEPGSLAFGATHGLAIAYSCACDDCKVLYVEVAPYSGSEQALTMAEPSVNTARARPLDAPPLALVGAPADVPESAPAVHLDGQEALPW